MTALTEARHAAEFIISEANGHRSRQNGTLVSGQDLIAGTVVMDNGSGKLTVYTAGDATDGGTSEAAGILIYAGDASGGDIAVSYIARDAEVNKNLITYPNSLTDNSDETNTITSLGYLGIIVRA